MTGTVSLEALYQPLKYFSFRTTTKILLKNETSYFLISGIKESRFKSLS
jgi:hypothetical protein